MITAQDIRDKGFEKNRKGGYDMESVDDFLEEVADSVAAYQKENTVLKSKMKVLVDKIEEYRANEEALNMAVLSAQKLAVQIEAEARARSAQMISDAEAKVREAVGTIVERTAAEEKKLTDAKTATEKFFESVRNLCSAQLDNLDAISMGVSAAKKTEAPPAVTGADESELEDAVRGIGESVSRVQDEPSVKFNLASAMKTPSKPKRNLDSTQPFTL